MIRAILFAAVWGFTVSTGWAQEQTATQTPADVAVAPAVPEEDQLTVEFHPRTGEEPVNVIAFHEQLKATCHCNIQLRYRDDVEVGQLILVARTPQEVAYREQLIPNIQSFQASGISVLEFSLLTADKVSTPDGIDPSARVVPAAIHHILKEEIARFGGNWRITGAPLTHPTDGIWEFQPQGSHLYVAWISGEHQLFGTVRIDTRKSPASLALTLSNPCRQFQVRDVQLQASIQWNQGEERQQGTSPQQLQLKFLFPGFDDPTSLTLQRIGTEPNNPAAESEHEEFKSRIQQLRSQQEAQLRADLDQRIANHAELAKTEPATSSKLTRMANDIQNRERALQALTKTVPFDWRERETTKFVGSWIITKSAEELGGFRGRLTIREDRGSLVMRSEDGASKLGLNDARLSLVRWEGLNRATLELGSGAVKTVVPVTYGWYGNQANESQPDQMTWSLALDGEYAKSDRENKPGFDKIYFRRDTQNEVGVGHKNDPVESPQPSVKKTQIHFAGPKGMEIGWQVGTAFAENQLQAPARYDFPHGGTYLLQLRNIPGHAGLTVYPTLHIVPQVDGDKVYEYLARNSAPVTLTNEDFEQVKANNMVTKVLYLPSAEFQKDAIPSIETLTSTKAEPGTDLRIEAAKRGAAIAVVQFANRKPQAGDPPLKSEPGKVIPPQDITGGKTLAVSELTAPRPAIILIIDPKAQQSEVVKQVVEALEKAGLAKAESPDKATPSPATIRVTLALRADEKYEKIKQLIEAVSKVGVQQLAVRAGGVQVDGQAEQNLIILTAQPDYTTAELHRIEQAITTSAKQCGLEFVLQTKIPGQGDAPEYAPKAVPASAGETTPQLSENSPVKVFTLKYAQATEVAEVLKQIYDKGTSKIVPDARTNSVIVTGPEAQLEEIEALLLKLDEGGPANPNARSVPVDPAQSEAAKLVAQLEDELAQLQQSVGANHPKVKELQARISAARQNTQPEATSSLPGTPATNVNPLGEIEHLDAEGERLRQRLEADKKNLERSQALMKEGLYSVQKAQEAEAPVRVSEALLDAHEAQRSAVLQKFKAQLLKALDDALEYFQSSGQIEKAELQDAEKQIEAIITQVDTSPQQALTAANHLISQLDSELVKRLEKAIESLPTDPQIGTWQTALRQAQRRARARKLLPGSLPGTETLSPTYDRAFQVQTEAGSRLPAVSPGNVDAPGSTSGEVHQQIAQLRKEYEAADSEARQLARQLQSMSDGAQKNEAQKADLRRAVQRAFTARQSLLRAELMEMQSRLLQTQRSIEMRERISDQIIQRRVEDLLNPGTEWDSPIQADDDATDTSASQTKTRRIGVYSTDKLDSKVLSGTPFKSGILLLRVLEGPARRAGLQDGDILVSLNRLATVTTGDLHRILETTSGSLRFEVVRAGQVIRGELIPDEALREGPRRVLAALKDIHPGERLVEGQNVAFSSQLESTLAPFNGDFVQTHEELIDRAAAIPLRAGDVIRKTKLTEKGQYGASAAIPKGMRVFTFSANDTHTHAGLLRPGDRVDVTVTFTDRKGDLVTKVLLECIEVFATENRTVHSEDAQNEQRPRSVSLLVTPEQSNFVKIAQSKGQLALSLRHPDDAEVNNLNGINSAIMEEMQRPIGEGELPRPSAEDETRWRSAVVEILVSGKSDVADNGARKVGFGIIVAADGTMLSHMGGGWATIIRDWPNIDAQFDDGSIVPLQVVDEGGSGFVVLRPRQSVNLNHHFPLSGTKTTTGDEVNVGKMVATSPQKNLYGMSATAVKVTQTERRVATLSGLPVWQLTHPERIPNSFCYPVLNQDGELLAITLADTGGLLLAVPVEKLREILPQSLGKLPTVPAAAQKSGPAAFMEKVQDILSEDAGELPAVPAKRTSAPQPAKGAEAPTDSKAALLAKLQGMWKAEFEFEEDFTEKDNSHFVDKSRFVVEVNHDLMSVRKLDGNGQLIEQYAMLIRMGDVASPQPIDLIREPEDTQKRSELKGIIEFKYGQVGICFGNAVERPKSIATLQSGVQRLRLRRPLSKSPQGLGVTLDLDPIRADRMPQQFRGGVRIDGNDAGGAAEKGGIRSGDILVGLGDWEIAGWNDLQSVIKKGLLGEIPYYIVRDGVIRKGYVRLNGAESSEVAAQSPPAEPQVLSDPVVDLQPVHHPVTVDNLQGSWNVHQTAPRSEGPWKIDIHGQRLTIDGLDQLQYEFQLGEGATQPIDFVIKSPSVAPEDEQQKYKIPKRLGIIRKEDGVIRICFSPAGWEERPINYGLRVAEVIWELRRKAATGAVTELEGDWHMVELFGNPVQGSYRRNLTFRGNVWTESSANGDEVICQLRVDAQEKRLYLKSENRDSEVDYRYALEGSRLLLRMNGQLHSVYERGLDPSIKVAGRPSETMPKDRLDPILEKLQGSWDMHMIEADPNPPGGKEEAVIERDLMTITITLDGKSVTIPVQLKLDMSPELYEATMDGKRILLPRPQKSRPAGSPQPIDLIHWPNDMQERMVLPGIIEFRDDTVRFCLANSSKGERPEVFAVGKDANIWELRRKPAVGATTELEGDWHLESATDATGKPREIQPDNWTIRGRQLVFDFSTGGQDVCQIDVNSQAKTIRWLKDSQEVYSQADYVLRGDQLTLHERPNLVKVLRRGHVRLAAAAPTSRSAEAIAERLKALQGTWTVDYYDAPDKDKVGGFQEIRISGDQLTTHRFDGEGNRLRVEMMKIDLGDSSDERAVDLVGMLPGRGTVKVFALYEITEDTLALTFRKDSPRPKEFGETGATCIRAKRKTVTPEPVPPPSPDQPATSQP